MRERKKTEAEEMLVVHKAAKAAEPDKSGRDRGAGPRRSAALEKEELDVLKKRFAAAKHADDKRSVLAEVQRKFGNEKAASLVKEARRKDDDLPAKLAPKDTGKKKQ